MDNFLDLIDYNMYPTLLQIMKDFEKNSGKNFKETDTFMIHD